MQHAEAQHRFTPGKRSRGGRQADTPKKQRRGTPAGDAEGQTCSTPRTALTHAAPAAVTELGALEALLELRADTEAQLPEPRRPAVEGTRQADAPKKRRRGPLAGDAEGGGQAR